MAAQIFKSVTSKGVRTREVQNAESKRDFIDKFKIPVKEADAEEYWLKLCKASEFYPKQNKEIVKELTLNHDN